MYIQTGSGGAQPQPSSRVQVDRIGRSARHQGERGGGNCLAAARMIVAQIVNEESASAAAGRIVGAQTPVPRGISGRGRRVHKRQPRIVLLEPQGVEAEGFIVNTIQPDAGAPLHDQIVRRDLIVKRGPRRRGNRLPGHYLRSLAFRTRRLRRSAWDDRSLGNEERPRLDNLAGWELPLLL